MKAWVTSQLSLNRYVTRPVDDPHVHAPGPDPLRLLLFGSGPAMGWGVVSHDIALPGSLARSMSAHTGRGTDVDVIAQSRLSVTSALRTLEELDLTSYAAIVITLGIHDAMSLVSVPRWRSELSEIADRLIERTASQARYFYVGILPIGSVPGFNTPLGRLASQQADVLNETTIEFCRSSPRCVFVPLSAADALLAPAERDGRTYRSWAAEITEIVAPELDRPRKPDAGREPEHPDRLERTSD